MYDQIKEKNSKQMYDQIKNTTVGEKFHCFFQILLNKNFNNNKLLKSKEVVRVFWKHLFTIFPESWSHFKNTLYIYGLHNQIVKMIKKIWFYT